MRAKILSLSLAVMFLVSTCVFSAEVGLKTAADVAKSFFYEQVGQERGMAYESIYILDHHASANNGLTDYRIFNFQQGGWVIVSGDDLVYPIIA